MLLICGYDAILGMNWLCKYHAQLHCKTKIVMFFVSREPILEFHASSEVTPILENRARKLLWKGAQEYLAYLINRSIDKVKIDKVLVVKKYADVFRKN